MYQVLSRFIVLQVTGSWAGAWERGYSKRHIMRFFNGDTNLFANLFFTSNIVSYSCITRSFPPNIPFQCNRRPLVRILPFEIIPPSNQDVIIPLSFFSSLPALSISQTGREACQNLVTAAIVRSNHYQTVHKN